LVALRLLSFEKKLFRHYNEALAEFIDTSYNNLIKKLLRNIKIYGFESIILSDTLRAIIYSYINFPVKNVKIIDPTNQQYIDYFFEKIFLYFSENQQHLVIANSDNHEKKYIFRIIISIRVAICNQEAWENYLEEPQIDEYWMLAMFQEAILVNLLNLTSRISNSFICNLPGCGDCITILKEHKNYFFFIECKLLEKRAKKALKSINLTEVFNVSIAKTPGISKGTNKRNHLLHKLDPLIKDRYLSCYLSNWSEESGHHIFSLILLENKLNKSAIKSEVFNVWISDGDINLINSFIGYDLKNLLNKRAINKFKSGFLKLKRLTLKQLSNSGINPSNINLSTSEANNKSFDLFITVKNTEKFYSKTKLPERSFNISNSNSLEKARMSRLKKFLEEQQKFKDNEEKNQKNKNYNNYMRQLPAEPTFNVNNYVKPNGKIEITSSLQQKKQSNLSNRLQTVLNNLGNNFTSLSLTKGVVNRLSTK